MTFNCQNLNPFTQKAQVLDACRTCPPSTKDWCAQLAADGGETAGVWGGLDLADPQQRASLPAPAPIPVPTPAAKRPAGRPQWCPTELFQVDPDRRVVSHHTRSGGLSDY